MCPAAIGQLACDVLLSCAFCRGILETRRSLTAFTHDCRVPRDQFFQFSWRPRAPTLLSKEQEAEIAKHLKDYSKRYDEIDSKLLQEVYFPCMIWL